jgi:hypothetical protein
MSEPKELLRKLPVSEAEHQVLANGIVIYSGPGWVQAFLDAGMNPAYHTITHLENGVPGAVAGPQLPSRYQQGQ